MKITQINRETAYHELMSCRAKSLQQQKPNYNYKQAVRQHHAQHWGSAGVAGLLLKKLQCTVSSQLSADFPVLMECPGQWYFDPA